MPDFQGALTQEERQKIDEWVKEHWRIGACPVCRKQNWVLADHIVMPVLYTGFGTTFGGSVYPQFMIICQECGLTIYINANKTGIVGG